MQLRRPPGSWIAAVLMALALLTGALVWSWPTVAQTDDEPREQVCEVATADQEILLFAEQINKNRIGYSLRRGRPIIPGPTVEMNEGECVAVTLKNRTKRRVSLHAHGVDYTTASDGTPLNDGCVAPRKKLTYVWQAHSQSLREDGSVEPGSAGYWHYHDHCRGSQHGTPGINKGLFGALIVRAPDDPRPDVEPCVLVMIGTTFAFKRAPDTPLCEANLGERAEFVVITHGDDFHTFHLHGHRWADTRSGSLGSPNDPSRVVDNKTSGPADSFGFQVIAGERVGPGAWMYHCHVQNHSELGMSGIFLVRNADGSIPPGAQEALDRFSGHSH
ncbi:MAG: multicopper oxidase domain-containing protein [Actinomycetota bacterium]